ncbi:TPA_asm: G [Pueraria betacytorhabdovirus 1]|nr:TPA_asm: G [Pueraria betacytorhabdovirus 1]
MNQLAFYLVPNCIDRDQSGAKGVSLISIFPFKRMDHESDAGTSETIREVIMEILRILKEKLKEILSSWRVGKGDHHNSYCPRDTSDSIGNERREEQLQGIERGRSPEFCPPKYEFDFNIQRGNNHRNSSKPSRGNTSGAKRSNPSISMKFKRRDTEDSDEGVFIHA